MVGPAFLALLSLAGFQDDASLRSRLKVVVSTVQETFDPIDLLPVTVRYTNVSNYPIKFDVNIAIFSYPPFYLEDPEGRRCRPISFMPLHSFPPHSIDLKSGEFFQATFLRSLSFLRREESDAGEFRVPAAGTWKVWAGHERAHAPGNSNVLSFRVQEDPAIPAQARMLLGNQSWHRFALSWGSENGIVERVRKLILSGVETPQRHLAAHLVGQHDLNVERPDLGIPMFRAALASKVKSRNPSLSAFYLVMCLERTRKFDEALFELTQNRPDLFDVARKSWDETGARVLKAKMVLEDSRRR